ncbi:MAG: hypothetical protein Q9163_003270 [Psora crenata]
MASTLDSKKRLALAIIDFLQTSLKDGTLQPEDSESIEIATSCIADTFHINPSNKTHMYQAIGSQNLLSIYGVYDKLKSSQQQQQQEQQENSQQNSKSHAGSTSAPASSDNSTKSGEPTDESEALKKQGNAAMSRKDYAAAIDLYTRALSIAPTNPIYLSNRAAAYSAASQHALAATDAEMAVAADPKYTKAWSRLGLAKFVLGDARASMHAYEQGIQAEGHGGSEAMRKGYETAKKKVEELEKEGGADAPGMSEDVDDAAGGTRGAGAGPPGGGMPDLSALAGMFGGGGGRGAGAGGAGGGGGMPDMASIMNNPMFASMAQNLMQNPEALQGLMNNPQLKQMAERFGLGGAAGGAGGGGAGAGAGAGGAGGGGGGAGGIPDIASLMQDPSIAEM